MLSAINTQSYDNLSVNCLTHLLKNFTKVYFEEKKPIIFALTKKYFQDKSCINLYNFILYFFKFRVFEERLNYILFVLGKELEGDMNDLPMEYREDFFRVLLQFLEDVEKCAQNQNSTVEWQLANIPKLLNYLGEIENSEITSYSLCQKINALVEKIKEDFDKMKEENAKVENALVPVNTQSLSLEETQEKLNQIKVLKLKKSKLNKGNLCDALSSFELYSDEDKDYLINYMYKHNWTDCVSSINDVVAFDYFSKHMHYVLLSDKYNPFRILCGAFSEIQNRFSEAYLKGWLEYFDVVTFGNMMEEVEKWYMSFDGATKQGWQCYQKLLLDPYLTSKKTYFMDNGEIGKYSKSFLISDYDKYLKFFAPYKGKTLIEWVEKVEVIPEYICVKYPKLVEGDKIIEEIKCIEDKKYLLSYYYEVYNKYSDKLFNYYGNFTSNSKVEVDLSVSDSSLFEEFIRILNTIVFDGEMLVTLKENKKINWNTYGSWNNECNIKKDVMCFIQTYFCQNSDKITDNLLKDLWFDTSHYKAFCFFTDYHNFSGAFKDQHGYSTYFFERLKSYLDFSKVEDLGLFFKLNGSYYTRSKLFDSFIQKFKIECVECYEILDIFLNSKIEGFEKDIMEFIKIYYLEENK